MWSLSCTASNGCTHTLYNWLARTAVTEAGLSKETMVMFGLRLTPTVPRGPTTCRIYLYSVCALTWLEQECLAESLAPFPTEVVVELVTRE